jgi:hypothetical protein
MSIKFFMNDNFLSNIDKPEKAPAVRRRKKVKLSQELNKAVNIHVLGHNYR